jgi:hypothetical protein
MAIDQTSQHKTPPRVSDKVNSPPGFRQPRIAQLCQSSLFGTSIGRDALEKSLYLTDSNRQSLILGSHPKKEIVHRGRDRNITVNLIILRPKPRPRGPEF